MSEYRAFLETKRLAATPSGFTADPATINPHLFPWQRAIVVWALERGTAALFTDTGTGKTRMQLAWAEAVADHTGGDVLILAPLAVTHQTAREGAAIGIPVTVCRSGEDVRPGINVANYERLHLFDPSRFVAVVLDESSVLKNYTGSTKRLIVESFAATPYRLACTATPAPNDHLELGNHAEFLGVLSSHEMIARWFIADQSAMGTYRLKEHGKASFWEWVASWGLSLRRPSDLGYSDEGYILPPLHVEEIIVATDPTLAAGDRLFRMPDLNATGLHKEGRLTAAARAQAVADLVNADTEIWAVWCNTDYEARELMARIPGAIEVKGSDTPEHKERAALDFADGKIRVLVSKARIFGYGMNFQHCARTAFVGLSYSMEQFYQALRRFYRFGQKREVYAYLVGADTEGAIKATVERKLRDHDAMMAGMLAAGHKLRRADDAARRVAYDPRTPLTIPDWLTTQETAA